MITYYLSNLYSLFKLFSSLLWLFWNRPSALEDFLLTYLLNYLFACIFAVSPDKKAPTSFLIQERLPAGHAQTSGTRYNTFVVDPWQISRLSNSKAQIKKIFNVCTSMRHPADDVWTLSVVTSSQKIDANNVSSCSSQQADTRTPDNHLSRHALGRTPIEICRCTRTDKLLELKLGSGLGLGLDGGLSQFISTLKTLSELVLKGGLRL